MHWWWSPVWRQWKAMLYYCWQSSDDNWKHVEHYTSWRPIYWLILSLSMVVARKRISRMPWRMPCNQVWYDWLLWKICAAKLNKKIQHKGTAYRGEKEAHLQIILGAVTTLYQTKNFWSDWQLLWMLIDLHGLSLISQFYPEQLGKISMTEKLHRLKAKVNNLSVNLHGNTCETTALREMWESCHALMLCM